MLIVYDKPNIMKFKELSGGDIFRYKNNLYIKIERSLELKNPRAINIDDLLCPGQFKNIDEDAIVEKAKSCILHVEF